MRKLGLLLLVLLFSTPAMADIEGVVSSIKPIHSLVQNVMGDTGKSEILVTGNHSPHGYHLKPSEVKMLEGARIIFYVDDGFETFLGKSLKNLDAKIIRVPLISKAKIELLETRASGTWESHTHDDHDHDHHGHDHEEHGNEAAQKDLHVWLDPKNAVKMVRVIEQQLSEAYPAQERYFKINAKRTIAKLNTLDRQMKTTLTPVKEKPYVVFHDAFQYLEKAYGLSSVGSITLSPEQAPSAKRVKQVRAKVKEMQAVCVFSEPQFSKRLVDSVMEDTKAKTRVLDEHGADLQPGTELYFALMLKIANQIAECLR